MHRRAVDARRRWVPAKCPLPRRPDSMVNVGFDLFSQNGTGSRIDVVDLGGMPDRSPAHKCGGPLTCLRQKNLEHGIR